MSHASISSPDRASWEIEAAILVYGPGNSLAASRDSAAYATVHGIEKRGQRYSLAAGMPATKEACATIARALGAASTLTGFIPENLLYLGASTLIWWRPPAPATVYFDTTKSAAGDQPDDKAGAALIGKCARRTAQPGLVFAVTPSEWFVYALKGDARPAARTDLLRAPYFNVWESGRICTGNVRLPETLSPAALARFERAFFDSEFTHPNVHGRKRLVRHERGAYAFWRELLDRPVERGFPEEALLDAELTIERLAKRLESDKGRDDD